ncbi:MAG: NlpC/P60 family protein [Lachnospiraceae bacterium]|nr:NlpC/P60 family protein [Lachnospiraceae bacterium]
MTNNQKIVLRKIIYAVETGGQVYGQQDYSDFTEAYTNSSEEHAITIGAGAWYGTEAKTLLERIYDADPEQWEKIDKVRLLEQVQTANWECFNISRVSQLANTIVALISSDLGVKCQDNLMDEQLATYAEEAIKQGVTDARAQAMCVNFRHQGGQGAVTRILTKTQKPYTLDNLYAACQTDTGNQVGAYKDRQRFVYNALKTYFPEEEKNMTKTEKAIQQMETWAKDDSHGYDQDYRWGEKGDYDCSSAVIQAWQNAGVPVKSGGATYTGDMKNVFLKNGFADVTSKVNVATGSGLIRGDVLLNEAHHVAMYCGNGKEVEASINEKGTAHGGQPGDQTGKEFLIRSYRNYPWDCILRYSENNVTVNDAIIKKQNTRAYIAQIKKDTKCYVESSKNSPSKMFPKLKKGAVVEVMKYTETDSSGLKWYFIRIPHPTEGFVFEFIPKGTFTRITEISK